MEVSVLHNIMSLILIFSLVSQVLCSSRITQFEKFDYKEPASKNIIATFHARSIVNCASLCSEFAECKSFIFADFSLECELLDTIIVNESKLMAGPLIFAKLATSVLSPTTTTSMPLPPVTTTASLPLPSVTTTTSMPLPPETTTASLPLPPVTTTTSMPLPPVTTTASLPLPSETTTTSMPLPPVTTMPVETTESTSSAATTSSASIPTVIDIVYGASMMCSDASNSNANDDLLVLTTAGVYIYDDINQLTNGPCNGPLEFTTVFNGFPSMPTSPNNVRGLLSSQAINEIELYADDDYVYRWRADQGALSLIDSRTYTDVLGTNGFEGVNFLWTTLFQDGGFVLRFFYLGNDELCASNNPTLPKSCVNSHGSIELYGKDVNPFKYIPANVIALEVINVDTPTVVLIDESGNVYQGTKDVASTTSGTIQF